MQRVSPWECSFKPLQLKCLDTLVSCLVCSEMSRKVSSGSQKSPHQANESLRHWHWLTPHNRYTTPVLRYGAIKNPYCHSNVSQRATLEKRLLQKKAKRQKADSRTQKQEFTHDRFFFWTHSNVVNSHPNGSVVIDLFCGDRLGLVSQEYAQQQQQTLVAVDHTYRKRETVREGR